MTAQSKVGVAYDVGEGVEEDDAEAVKWHRKAAEQGDLLSWFFLAEAHASVEGVIQDWVQAHAWSNVAAESGMLLVPELRDEAADYFSPEQLAEATKLARQDFEKCNSPGE